MKLALIAGGAVILAAGCASAPVSTLSASARAEARAEASAQTARDYENAYYRADDPGAFHSNHSSDN